MTEPHILIVPEDLDASMEVEHPPTCPQRGHADLVFTAEGYCACLVERIARNPGLDAHFRREDEPHPFFEGTRKVTPGRHPIALRPVARTDTGADAGLCLAGEVDAS